MSKEQIILEALSGVSDSFILEASQHVGNPEIGMLQKPQSRNSAKHYFSAAAMIAVALTALFGAFVGIRTLEAAKNIKDMDTSLSYTLSVSDDKSVKVVLETTETAEDYRQINRVLVYDSREKLLQSITAEDTVSGGIFLNEGLYINVGRAIGEPDIRDVNFDGYTDLGLLACSSYPRNVPYNYFLWNDELNKFEFGFTVFGATALTVDDASQSLIVADNTTTSTILYQYRYENGSLSLLSEQEQPADTDQLDGIFIDYPQQDYIMTRENDMLYIRSRYASTTIGEECELEIRFVNGLYPYAAAQLAQESLERSGLYSEIQESVDNRGNICLSATSGTELNSPCAEIQFCDVGAAGTYQLTSRYNYGASDGHGTNFRRFMDTAVCSTHDAANAEVEKVITDFANAFFAGNSNVLQNYLAETSHSTEIYQGQGELVQYISLTGLDTLSERGDAVVSLTFLETPNSNSYTYLTMDVTNINGEYRILNYTVEK